MTNRKSLRRNLGRIFSVYTEAGGAVFMLFGALLELTCGAQIGFDNPIGILGWHAAILFTVIALLQVLYIVRREARYSRWTS